MKPLLLFIFLFSFSGYASTEENQTQAKTCCFTNPEYAGVCQVTPAKDETCEGILKYLNTPDTVGKTYCTNTRIRGGWKRVLCDDKTQPKDKQESKTDRPN